MIRKPKMVLIDVDGTLVDSVPDLAFCVDEMMGRLGRPKYGEAKVRDWVGNGVSRLVRRALVGQLDGEPLAAAVNALTLSSDSISQHLAISSSSFSSGITPCAWPRPQN